MHTGSDVEEELSTGKEQAPLLTDSPPADSDSDEVSVTTSYVTSHAVVLKDFNKTRVRLYHHFVFLISLSCNVHVHAAYPCCLY